MQIEHYVARPAEYLPYDDQAPVVAARLIEAIKHCRSVLGVHHIGSTAVPGCAGKGIIDLLVTYPDGSLWLGRSTLDQMGFQHQLGPEPFPELRPMRVGALIHEGKTYLVHAHVIRAGDREVQALLAFRDRLRADADLRQAYQQEKLAILGRGITASTEYSKAKGDFIRGVLADCFQDSPAAPALDSCNYLAGGI